MALTVYQGERAMIVIYDGPETLMRVKPTRLTDTDKPHDINLVHLTYYDGIYVATHWQQGTKFISTYSTNRCDVDIIK